MTDSKSPWVAQAFILVLYVITLIIYNRAKKEYVGGKIGAAISLIMVFVAFLFLSDYVDYFLSSLLPLGEEARFSLKILFRLLAICVLAFGGLRFFVSKEAESAMSRPVPTFGMGSVGTADMAEFDSVVKASMEEVGAPPAPVAAARRRRDNLIIKDNITLWKDLSESIFQLEENILVQFTIRQESYANQGSIAYKL